MKNWMTIIIATISSIALTAQPPQITANLNNDVAMLIELTNTIQQEELPMVCLPWAYSPRLVSISENGQPVQDLLSYENLWMVVNENFLKTQNRNTCLELIVSKKGKIKSLQRNGQEMNLKRSALKIQKFKKLISDSDKQIKIIVNIG